MRSLCHVSTMGKQWKFLTSEYLERSGSFILKDTIPMDFHLEGQKKQKKQLEKRKNIQLDAISTYTKLLKIVFSWLSYLQAATSGKKVRPMGNPSPPTNFGPVHSTTTTTTQCSKQRSREKETNMLIYHV